jgi:hypothetical protein
MSAMGVKARPHPGPLPQERENHRPCITCSPFSEFVSIRAKAAPARRIGSEGLC